MTDIFISHSRRDRRILGTFDSIFAGTAIRAIRAEFEDYSIPPWSSIKNWVASSAAVFLLLGPSLKDSLYTSNWVSYEVGLASALNKDVWVFEQINQPVDFPVPYLNHYVLYDPAQRVNIDYIKSLISAYDQSTALGAAVLFGLLGAAIAGPEGAIAGGALGLIAGQKHKGGIPLTCGHSNCGVTYFLHTNVNSLICPSCRQPIVVVAAR